MSKLIRISFQIYVFGEIGYILTMCIYNKQVTLKSIKCLFQVYVSQMENP